MTLAFTENAIGFLNDEWSTVLILAAVTASSAILAVDTASAANFAVVIERSGASSRVVGSA